MKKDELIHMWQEGNDRLFRDELNDKDMITQFLSEKTLKGNRSINFNLLFYGAIQLANIILLSMNLAGYMSNHAMIWVLIAQLLFTIGTLVFGIDVFYKFREITNYSDSLQNLIQQQLWFFRKPYELWLVLASLSVIVLMSNVNLYIDNDNGTYVINHKMMYVGVTFAAFLFIYGTQKARSLLGLRRLKAYLADLQEGELDRSEGIERNKRRYFWLWIAVCLLLCVSLALGLLTALG